MRQCLPASSFNHLEHWTDGKTSLRQLARYLNREPVTVARAIYPLIQKGWVQLVYPAASNTVFSPSCPQFSQSKTPKIVCIDEDLASSQALGAIFSQHQLNAIFFNNAIASSKPPIPNQA